MRGTRELLDRFPALKQLSLGRIRRRIPIVRQLTATDCGAASLATVLGYHGKYVCLEELRNAIGICRGGASAVDLLRVGRAYGLRGRGVRVEIGDLDELPRGSILYWEFRHFVVLDRRCGETVLIVDPATGWRSVPMHKFRRAFTGVALIFEPTEAFEPGKGEPKRIAGLVKLILERRDLLGRIITASLLVQLLSLAMPLFTGVLIDRVVPRKDYSLLVVLAIGFCALQVFNAAAGFIRAHLMIHLRAQLEVRFTLRFLDHLIELPYSFFQQRTYGDLMVRLSSNNSVREILTSTVFSALMDGMMASVYLVLLIFVSGPLTLVVVVLAAARLALLLIMRWRQRELLSQSIENQSRSQSYQVEMLSGIETLKAMGLEHQAAQNWSNVFVNGLNISIKRGRLDALFGILMSGLGTLSTLVMMFYGTYLVLNGAWTLGTMMAFTAVANGFLTPLSSLASSVLQLQMIEVYLERLNDVMEAPAEQDTASVVPVGVLAGAVTLEEVSFQYSAQDPLVVRGVSIDVQPGSRVALVGRTGSGKSTLARLMAGLYVPTLGRILYDGKDLKTLDRRSVRSQLGIVTQETQLFGGSVRRNIALSDPEMSLDRVVQAAKLACIHDEIIAMQMGYETPLSDRGMSMSGGQRQRLAIARAIAINPKILILDEATSHLDALTEEKVIRNLASLRCTTFVIAHRLSTVREADLILMLDSGRIVELGRHEDLLEKRGKYAALVEGQRDREFDATQRL